MKRKFTRYPQAIKANRHIYSASDISDFEIDEDGVLIKYHGNATNVVIPDSVTRIEDQAFCFRKNLESVTIPNSVTSIGQYAFYGCSGLTNIKIPNSVTSIGNHAFHICTSLTSIKIPDSVTGIGAFVFSDCTSLTSVTIPDSVTWIGIFAFDNCTNLTNIKIPSSVTEIASSAFEGCKKLPKDVKNYISQLYYDDGTKFFSDDDDEYKDDEMSFEDWYDSSQGEADGMEFVDKLESLVRSSYNVDDFFEEPSTQRYQGGDFIWITLSDGSKYEFEFDWNDEQVSIYEDGPEAAAKSYFQRIQEGIDSGSALVEE